jgi:hypothetical protein
MINKDKIMDKNKMKTVLDPNKIKDKYDVKKGMNVDELLKAYIK